MLNPLLQAWLESAIKYPPAYRDARRFFEEAQSSPHELSILVSSAITRGKYGYLARWTRSELFVLPLTKVQQRDFGLLESQMKTVRHQLPVYGAIPYQPTVGLADFRLSAAEHDSNQPLSGCVQLTMDQPQALPLSSFSLGIEYYTPAVSIPVYQYCYPALPIHQGQLSFSFQPLAEAFPKTYPRTSLAVFCRLLVADSYQTYAGVRSVSNLVGGIVKLN